MVHREVAIGLVRPLDDAESVAEEVIVKSETVDIIERVEAVEIHVVEGKSGIVLVDEDESRAASELVGAQPLEDALRQGRLAGTEVSSEQDNIAPSSTRTYLTTDLARGIC